MSFNDLNLQHDFIASIKAAGYQSPTRLQSQLIPLVAERKSALVLSQSAAGKTGAFLIPAINYILENPAPEKRGARVLILTSRRDRVSQINYTIKRLTRDHNMRFGFIVSGRPYQTQMRLMRRPLDIMIATPGRLNDLMENKKADFSQLEMLIVDDLGSIYQKNLHGLVENILKQTNNNCPSLVFVNNDPEVTSYAQTLFSGASIITVEEDENEPGQQTSNNRKMATSKFENNTSRNTQNKPPPIDPENVMPQKVHIADDYTHKIALMDHFMDEFSAEPTVIYTSTRKVASTLQDNLTNHGHSSVLLQDLTSDELVSGDFNTLIISDQDKHPQFNALLHNHDTHLIHFDLPYKTGNFFNRLEHHDKEREKKAILIVDGRNFNELKQIEKTLGGNLEQFKVPGLEPLQPFVNQSKLRTTSNHRQNSRNKNNRNKKKTFARKSNNRNKSQTSSAKTATKNTNSSSGDNQSRRQRKGPFGRLNGGVHRKQGDNYQNQGAKPNNRTNAKNNNRGKKIGLSARGTSAPDNDRAWQSDFVEPQERKTTSKRVVIRYKDKKRSLLTENLKEE